MQDKLCVEVPRMRALEAPHSDLVEAAIRNQDVPGFIRTAHYYAGRLDLREYGTDAILHVHCRRGNGNHKLELLETGGKKYGQIVADIQRVVKGNVEDLRVMRLDLAVDVADVPVGFFHRFARMQWAQFHAGMEVVPVMQSSYMGKRHLQTLYWGMRSSGSVLRVYDKRAEYEVRYRRLKKITTRVAFNVLCQMTGTIQGSGMEGLDGLSFPPCPLSQLKKWFPEQCEQVGETYVPTFEETFGVPEDATLTRVERQIGADRIPDDLNVLGEIPKRLPEYNPFERLVIERGVNPKAVPTDKLKVNDYLKALALQKLLEIHNGNFTHMRNDLAQRTKNSKRLIDRYAKFLPAELEADGSERGVSEGQLREMYDYSIRRQLAA